MARSIRIEYPGAFYHVFGRGNERREIYRDDDDRAVFVQKLAEASATYGFTFHAYALMPNHYHLLLETPSGDLSLGMRHINGTYTQSFNRRHDRVGHLFQGRFKALLVERDAYLLSLSRYIHRNPVKAGLVAAPWHYRWSSCRPFLGLEQPTPWLELEATMRHFGTTGPEQRRAYASFVSQGPDADPREGAVGQLLLGSEDFVAAMKARARELAHRDDQLGPRRPLEQTPSAEEILETVERLTRCGLGSFRSGRTRSTPWCLALYFLRTVGRLSLKEVGRRASVSSSTVSETVAAFKRRLGTDEGLRDLIRTIGAEFEGGEPKSEDVTP